MYFVPEKIWNDFMCYLHKGISCDKRKHLLDIYVLIRRFVLNFDIEWELYLLITRRIDNFNVHPKVALIDSS